MDALIRRLREKLLKWHDNDALQQALSACTALKDGMGGEYTTQLERVLTRLREEGIWDADDQAILDEVKKTLGVQLHSVHDLAADFTVNSARRSPSHKTLDPAALTTRPGQPVPRIPLSSVTPIALPMELYGLLNQTYHLHTLAVEPETLLPAGKSLLSVLSRAHTSSPATSVLHERVENMVHRAFWDEVLESLSNPSPPVQLSRLKRLYEDLHVALLPLLASDHPVLYTLSSPLSPTSSPLRSAIIHMREILASLKERCAPARDPQIDTLQRVIEDPPDDSLAKALVEFIRSLLKLSDEMKDDLSQFVLGRMNEGQLRDVVIKQAVTGERGIVHQLWKGRAFVDAWTKWLQEGVITEIESNTPSTHRKFVRRLMRAIGENQAVACNLPTLSVPTSGGLEPDSTPEESPPIPANSLPPPLLFITPTLFYVQNYIQALVITAALRALVRIPTTPAKRKADSEENEVMSEGAFLQRIWTLLKGDVDGTDPDLKLVNLADEVVRISKAYGGTLDGAGVQEAKESQLRDAVDRTLKPTDPVFLLLHKRLIEAVTTHLLDHSPVPTAEDVPKGMTTGRSTKKAAPKPSTSTHMDGTPNDHVRLDFVREILPVKGFDHPVLAEPVSDMLLMLRRSISWTELVWPELFSSESS